jgi:hypothetical protein
MDTTGQAAQEITDGRGVSLKDGLSYELAARVKGSGRNGCLMNIESYIPGVSPGAAPVSRLVCDDSKLPYRGCAFST